MHNIFHFLWICNIERFYIFVYFHIILLFSFLFSYFLTFLYFSILSSFLRCKAIKKKEDQEVLLFSFSPFLLSSVLFFSAVVVSVVLFCHFQILSRFQFFKFIKDHIIQHFDVRSLHTTGSGFDHTGTLEFSKSIYNN